MTRPRLAIRDLMVGILLIGANCVALRWLTTPTPIATVVLVVLLPINLLLTGLVRIGYCLARRRSCGPFAIGLQLLGWPVTFALGTATLHGLVGSGGEWLHRYFDVARVPAVGFVRGIGLGSFLTAPPGSWGSVAADTSFFLIVLGLPLSAFCVLGSFAIRATVRLLHHPRESSDVVSS